MIKKKKLATIIILMLLSITMLSVTSIVSATSTTENASFGDILIRTAAKQGGYHTDGVLVDYSIKHGNVEKKISDFTTYTSDLTNWNGSLGAETDNANAVNWKIFSQKNDGIIVAIKAKQKVKITIENKGAGGWRDGAIVSVFRHNNIKNKLVTISSEEFNANNTQTAGIGTYCIAQNDMLYWQFKFEWDGFRNMENIPSFKFEQAIASDAITGDEAEAPSFADKQEIGLVDIVKEVVTNETRKVELKDMTISLQNGKVVGSMDNFAHYLTKEETSGTAYYAASTNEAGVDLLNNKAGATFSSWRILTTLDKNAIISITAKENMKLTISHAKTAGGWIDNTEQYIGLYVKSSLTNKIYTIWEKSVATNVNEANVFGGEVSVTKGDICFWVFGTNVGTERSLDIVPNFVSNLAGYSAEEVEKYMKVENEIINMWDALTSTINNNYNDAEYQLVNFGFYYGTFKNMQKFSYHIGDGSGSAADALWSSASISEATGFLRWQIQCSNGNDAIMVITANENIQVKITHTAIWQDAWSTHTGIKYYAVDGEGTRAQLFSKMTLTGTAENDYGIEVSLKKGDKLLIDYFTNNGEYGSLNFAPTVNASTKDYNEAKRPDFAKIKEVQVLIKEKSTLLATAYGAYDLDLYTLSKQATLEDIYASALIDIEEAQTKEKVNEIYDKAIEKMDNVQTKAEEAVELEAYKTTKLSELKAYVETLGKKNYSSKNWKDIQELVTAFESDLKNCATKSSINIKYNSAKASIDLVQKTKGCKGNIENYSVILAVISLIVCVSYIMKKRTKN